MKGLSPRTERIEFRLTPAQKLVIKHEANLSNMSIADYILSCVKKDINRMRSPDEYIEFMYET